MPRVLIADDEPVSLQFLAAAVRGFGCDVVAVANAEQAISACRNTTFDLLLLDRRMPDLTGAQLLARLRSRNIATPAMATSAEVDARIDAELRAAGFLDVIVKPVSIDDLHGALHPYLHAAPLLDDACAVSGDAQVLRPLRKLFAAELAKLESEWPALDAGVRRERLHRLRASCGFCGATALGDATRELEAALCAGADESQPASRFMQLCRMTQAALGSA